MNAECPVCEANVYVGGAPKAGEPVECRACGAELEVTSLMPLALQEATATTQEEWGQ